MVMALYYGYRLFAFTPWYDELYTYYCFISRGPVYAAVHWPLPNNHVGYSVLSAFLDYLGNPYIGLRGVSYLCALANMYLIYRIAGRYLKDWMALITVILYISMNLVNQQAVQGRGYTLGITCFLLSWNCMIRICEQKQTAKKIYVFYTLALALGLYAVPSNVYWVLPLCMAGGSYLLMQAVKKSRQEKCSIRKSESAGNLIKLVAASVAAALVTIALYGIIWLAIGSNLLVKEEKSGYFGMSHVQMILKAPFAAIGRGMEYMLATPYIQSEERTGFIGRLMEWLATLSGYYYNSLWILVVLLWGAGLIYLFYKLIKETRYQESKKLLLYLVLAVEIVFIPICLLIQCKRPYYRVFTYSGVLFAMLLGVLLESGLEYFRKKFSKEKMKGRIYPVVLLLTLAFGVKCIAFSGYNNQYGLNEYEIQDALSHGQVEKWKNYCVTDCNQEYLLYFLYHIRCENREIEGADMVLLDKRMTDPAFDEMVWEFYHYYNSIPWEYIEQNMILAYENENYILYTKNTVDEGEEK